MNNDERLVYIRAENDLLFQVIRMIHTQWIPPEKQREFTAWLRECLFDIGDQIEPLLPK